MNTLSKEGDTYKDFIVKRCLQISELNATLIELEHRPSGAEVMHIACDDPENLFCLGFRTLPTSSNGAPHILEHTVLCGSKKFPIKDPFFSMTRRSLNTFMNAMTGSDFTCYPAASQNEKDFYNLLDVYLDAVFHPELKKMSFLQEGHRLEFSDPSDSKTPLQIKGIVYNEMKGALASADARLWHALMEELVPNLPYAYNSGGDPKVIPQLSYKELIQFHSTYYHPSHCLFFFYGNFSLKKHLDVLLETTLKGISKKPALPKIEPQPRFSKPVEKEITYPIGQEEESNNRSFVAFAFLTSSLLDQETVLGLCLLDAVLMDNDGSLLKAELLKSGLCVHVEAFIDTEMSEVPYAIVFKGCNPDDADKIEQFLFQALDNIALTGIPDSAIQAALHQLEFSRLEITGEHAPFGLTLFMRAALSKQQGCPPENALMVHSLFTTLLSRLSDPTYLPQLIKKHFTNNSHRVRLVMRPDPELSTKEIAQEQQMLSQVQSKLSEQEVLSVLKQTQELELYQKKAEEQSIDCLPKIELFDISPKIRTFSLAEHRKGDLTIYHHDCFTNHISYADLFFDLPAMEKEELSLASLLFALLPELGCGQRTFAQNLSFIQSYIGGISLSSPLYLQVDNPQQIRPALHIRAKALDRHLKELFLLMKEMVESPRFDEKQRIEELLKKHRESLLNQLNRKALRYASHLAFSNSSQASFIQECWYGLTYFQFIEQVVKEPIEALIEKLKALKEKLFTFHNLTLLLSANKEVYEEVIRQNAFDLGSLQTHGTYIPWQPRYQLPNLSSQARSISSHVAFTVHGFQTVGYLSKHSAALTVATALLDNLILHPEVREQGGAYGVGAHYSSSSGQFYFHAYRDPHIASTLSSFDRALSRIAEGQFSLQNLEEAKISLIQHMDAPIAPSTRALTAYTWLREAKTDKMRQQFRTHLLALTPADIQEALFMTLLKQKDQGMTVSFAGKELLDKENLKLASSGYPTLPIFGVYK